MVEQLTMEDAVVYEQQDTYIIEFVSEYGFRTDWCKAKTETDAELMIREKYRDHKEFRCLDTSISNKSVEEIEASD